MGHDDLASLLDQVHDGFGRDFDGLHLLGKGVAQGVSAQGDYNTLFLSVHFEVPSMVYFVQRYLNTRGVPFSSSFFKTSAGSANLASMIIAAIT